MVKNYKYLQGRPVQSPVGKSPAPSRARRRSFSNKNGTSSSSKGSSGSGPAIVANINVAVRVRPENSREQEGGQRNIIRVIDKNMLVFDPQDEEEGSFFFKGKRQGMRDLNKKAKKDKTFTFDNVYSPGSTNTEVFEGTTKEVVTTLFDGYNCCVFAYGATGSGKTHTMLGSQENPGIVFMTMREIFDRVELKEDTHVEIFLSYLEVYNETVRDLLTEDQTKVLNVREDNKQTTSIPGLSVHKPKDPNEILRLLSYGNNNRSQHPTDHNKESSRSHAVLQIIVQQKAKDAGLSAEVKTAKLSMIDLAGSEKGTATGFKGARFREGANINKSLLALGNCITALANGSKYIPYRDSKLTRLLKDSIGGNCSTVMIANISPNSLTYEDTLNTLKYADRAKKIKVDLKKNVMSVDFHIAQYAKIVEDLRSEIVTLKDKIRCLEEENAALAGSAPAHAPAPAGPGGGSSLLENEVSQVGALKAQLNSLLARQQDYDALKVRLALLEAAGGKPTPDSQSIPVAVDGQTKSEAMEKLLDERRTLVEKIGNEKSLLSNLQLKAKFKEMQEERGALACLVQAEKDKSALKSRKAVESIQRKMEKKEERIAGYMKKLGEVTLAISEQTCNNPEAQDPHTKISLEEYKAENSLLHDVVDVLGVELDKVHALLRDAAPLLVRREKLLRGHSLLSAEDKNDFVNFQGKILGSQAVTWAENINNSVSVDQELALSVYKQCSRLDLPNLTGTTRASSVEQRSLFPDQTVDFTLQGQDETDSAMTTINPSPVKNIFRSNSTNQSAPSQAPLANQSAPSQAPLANQKAPSLAPLANYNASSLELPTRRHSPASILQRPQKLDESAAQNTQRPPRQTEPEPPAAVEPELQRPMEAQPPAEASRVEEMDQNDTLEMLPATPVIPLVRSAKKQAVVEFPPTPLLTRQTSLPRPPGNSTTNTSFVETPDQDVENLDPQQPETRDTDEALQLTETQDGLVDTPATTTKATPKRLAEGYSEADSPSKRARVQTAWNSHRPVASIPESPLVLQPFPDSPGVTPSGQNTFFPAAADSPVVAGNTTFTADSPAPHHGGLNETVTLVARLDEQCEIGTTANPAPANNFNSTFAVEEEPMDVDATRSISDMSIIQPPPRGSVVHKSPRSPVRAGMGISPRGESRRATPSPLRQSTLLDLKALPPQSTGRGGGAPHSTGKDFGSRPAINPNGKKMVKRKLVTSQSTSVLPRIPKQQQQPTSKQQHPGPKQQPPPSFRSTIQRLNNPAKDATESGANYMNPTKASSNKTDKADVAAGMKKGLKRSASSVLRQTNKKL